MIACCFVVIFICPRVFVCLFVGIFSCFSFHYCIVGVVSFFICLLLRSLLLIVTRVALPTRTCTLCGSLVSRAFRYGLAARGWPREIETTHSRDVLLPQLQRLLFVHAVQQPLPLGRGRRRASVGTGAVTLRLHRTRTCMWTRSQTRRGGDGTYCHWNFGPGKKWSM